MNLYYSGNGADTKENGQHKWNRTDEFSLQ